MELPRNSYRWWLMPIAVLLFGLGFSLTFCLFPKAFATTGAGMELAREAQFVTVYEGGRELTVKTTAPTVRELLTRLDIAYAEGDVIEPALDTELDEDQHYVSVLRARPVLISVGAETRYVMTAAQTPRMIFAAAGIEVGEGDEIMSIPRSGLGLETGLVAEAYELKRAAALGTVATSDAVAETSDGVTEAGGEVEVVEAIAIVAAEPVRPEIPAKWAKCADLAREAGVSEDDLYTALTLIYRESSCRVDARNKSSGAYGIPQALPGTKMAAAGEDWETNPITQIRWMISYVHKRYGSWAAALQHSDEYRWY